MFRVAVLITVLLLWTTQALAFETRASVIQSTSCKIYYGLDRLGTVTGTYYSVGQKRILVEDDGGFWYVGTTTGNIPVIKNGQRITVKGILGKGPPHWVVVNGVTDVASDLYRGSINVFEVNGKRLYLYTVEGVLRQKSNGSLYTEAEDGKLYDGMIDSRLNGKKVTLVVWQGPFARYGGFIDGKDVYGPATPYLKETLESSNCDDVRRYVKEHIGETEDIRQTPYGIDLTYYGYTYLKDHIDLWKSLAKQKKVPGVFVDDGIIGGVGDYPFIKINGNKLTVEWDFAKKLRDTSRIRVFVRSHGLIQSDTDPYIKNNRVLVPYRAIAEALNASVSYDWKTKTVTLQKGNRTVTLVIGEDIMKVDGNPVSLDVAPELLNNRTHVPLRAITEALGAEVEWDKEGKLVIVR